MDYREFHQNALVVDAANTLLNPDQTFDESLKTTRLGGVDVALVTVGSNQFFAATASKLAAWYEKARMTADEFVIAKSAGEMRSARESGKLAVVFHFQNTKPFEGRLDLVTLFHELGVRVVGLTYNEKNLVGDGCTERTSSGLSEYGIQLIKKLEEVGVLVDLSHVGYQTCREALEVSTKPVIFSHTNARGVLEHPRNVPDDLLKGVAETGGVVCLNVFPSFVASDNPTIQDVMRHVDYVSDLVGPEHVGFGLDLNTGGDMKMFSELKFKAKYVPLPPWVFPEGIAAYSEYPNLTRELLAGRYSEDEVKAILGGNLMRVFDEVFA